jgi:hypothetical protein
MGRTPRWCQGPSLDSHHLVAVSARDPTWPAGPESECIWYAQQSIAGLPPSPPAGPAPGPSALHRATKSARIRSRSRPAPLPQGATALANKLGSERMMRCGDNLKALLPDRRQGTILAQDAAWQLLPSSEKRGPIGPRDILDRQRDHGYGRCEVSSTAKRSRDEGLERTRRALLPRVRAFQARAIPGGRCPGRRPGAVAAVTRRLDLRVEARTRQQQSGRGGTATRGSTCRSSG